MAPFWARKLEYQSGTIRKKDHWTNQLSEWRSSFLLQYTKLPWQPDEKPGVLHVCLCWQLVFHLQYTESQTLRCDRRIGQCADQTTYQMDNILSWAPDRQEFSCHMPYFGKRWNIPIAFSTLPVMTEKNNQS